MLLTWPPELWYGHCFTILSISASVTFHTDPHIQLAYADWITRVDDPTPLITILKFKCSQTTLTRRVHSRKQRNVPFGDERTQAFRLSLRAIGMKEWIKIRPTAGLETHI